MWGHDGRAENAGGEPEHASLRHDLAARTQARSGRAPVGIREGELRSETTRRQQNQCGDDAFEASLPKALQPKHRESESPGEHYAHRQRQAEEQLQRHRAADDLRKIAGDDRDLAKPP